MPDGTSPPTELLNGFLFRDARPEDRDQVMQFTAHTWGEDGDYIQHVFDDWLEDDTGRFVAIEERATGRIAGIDKLTMSSPNEAWFEGLRVNPDFRGRALASRSQLYMIGEAKRLGAHTARLVTLMSNTPVHIICYRHGFSLKLVARHWQWQANEAADETHPAPLILRVATPEEADTLYNWWRTGAAYRTAGLAYSTWQYAHTSSEEWALAASEDRLYVMAGLDLAAAKTPPPTLLLPAERRRRDTPQWEIAALAGPAATLSSLLVGLQQEATKAGISQVSGLFPEAVEVYQALEAAGFKGDTDEERLGLFELALD